MSLRKYLYPMVDDDDLLEPPRPVPVREAAYQLCRLYDQVDPSPDDLRRWSNMIRVWAFRHPAEIQTESTSGHVRYLLLELVPYAERWRARRARRGPPAG